MPSVELIYDRDCPHVGLARMQLLRAFAQTGMPARWREWYRDDDQAPGYVKKYGSPTILINGQDIEPGVLPDAACCRLYAHTAGGYSAAPSMEKITRYLQDPVKQGFNWGASGVWGPAVGVAFLPKLVCPACWPAYAAVVSSLGLPFLLQPDFLLPLTLTALVSILGLLFWRAPARHGYGPFLLGFASSVVIVTGKFFYPDNTAAYGGAGLLLAACIWNNWRGSIGKHATPCPDCSGSTPEQAGGNHGNSNPTG